MGGAEAQWCQVSRRAVLLTSLPGSWTPAGQARWWSQSDTAKLGIWVHPPFLPSPILSPSPLSLTRSRSFFDHRDPSSQPSSAVTAPVFDTGLLPPREPATVTSYCNTVSSRHSPWCRARYCYCLNLNICCSCFVHRRCGLYITIF